MHENTYNNSTVVPKLLGESFLFFYPFLYYFGAGMGLKKKLNVFKTHFSKVYLVIFFCKMLLFPGKPQITPFRNNYCYFNNHKLGTSKFHVCWQPAKIIYHHMFSLYFSFLVLIFSNLLCLSRFLSKHRLGSIFKRGLRNVKYFLLCLIFLP